MVLVTYKTSQDYTIPTKWVCWINWMLMMIIWNATIFNCLLGFILREKRYFNRARAYIQTHTKQAKQI